MALGLGLGLGLSRGGAVVPEGTDFRYVDNSQYYLMVF